MDGTSLIAWMAWTWQTAAFFGLPLWAPLGIALVYAFVVFRWV